MNRKKLLITLIILFVLIVGAVVGGYFYLTNTQAPKAEPEVVTTGSLAENEAQNTTQDTYITDQISASGTLPKLRHLTTAPVAGQDFVSTKNGFVIWYVDRATGNIFETSTSTTETTRITNTTIPKVYEAYIGKGGSNIILRTLNETNGSIQTFIGAPKPLPKNSTSTDTVRELGGVFTSDTISLMSMSPSKDSFFGMTGTNSGVGNIYTFAAKSNTIFSHPLKKWVPQWVNASTILLTSAPSAKTQNISYFLNTSTKAFTKVIGPRNGLVVSSSPDAAHILFSENKGNKLVFGTYDPKKNIETPITSATIPDKCVWSKKDTSVAYCGFPKNTLGIFPDDWYQGKVLFNDDIRSLDVNTLQFNTLLNLEQTAGGPIDAINLTLSPDEKYLLFMNKRDLSLWMLEL